MNPRRERHAARKIRPPPGSGIQNGAIIWGNTENVNQPAMARHAGKPVCRLQERAVSRVAPDVFTV